MSPLKNAVPAKVGTQPWTIILDRRDKLQVGKQVRFRAAMHGSKWQVGIVENLDPLRLAFL
jgi:hypothetical protein